MLSHSLQKYIQDNKLRIVGEPLPKDNEQLDLQPDKDFEFAFEVGLVPDFKVPLSAEHKFTLYQVSAEEALIDEYVEEMRLRYGNLTHPEVSGDEDILVGDFVELDEKGEILAGGILKSSAINIKKIPTGKSKEKFLGRKEGEKLTLKMDEITKDAHDLMGILDISHDKAHELKSSFQFNIKHVHHINPAEVNQEWWDKLFGPGKVNNSEDFRNRIKQELTSVFGPQGERKLQNEMVDYLMKNTAITLPETFLKKWLGMVRKDKEPMTEAQANMEFEVYSQSIKWRLVEDKIMKDNNLSVTHQEVMDYTHSLVHGYLGQQASEQQVSETTKRILGDEKEVNRIYERLYDMKLTDLLKKTFTIETKEVKREEFEKLMEGVK